jgi:periplasmic divalent cation tolerance protein
MTGAIMVITTTATLEDARRIAHGLVERRLAACVQIAGPITSIYRWEGAVEEAAEYQCWFKTRGDLFAALAAAIGEMHPYETPEILAVPAAAGSEAYLAWLRAETGG